MLDINLRNDKTISTMEGGIIKQTAYFHKSFSRTVLRQTIDTEMKYHGSKPCINSSENITTSEHSNF